MVEHPIYGALGIRPIINADTTLTVLGSPLTSPAVLGAMAAAADVYVDMHELAGVRRRAPRRAHAQRGSTRHCRGRSRADARRMGVHVR